MISNRPYLLRAFHQWIIDSRCTPILVIDAKHPRCKIPEDYVEGGEIVFNISPMAVRDLIISNELVEFRASFSGIIHIISVPIQAILSIYAEENGEGLYFDGEEMDEGESGFNGSVIHPDTSKNRSHLKELAEVDREQAIHVSPDKTMNKTKPILKLVE